MSDVARRAGVSLKTVSRVVNGEASVAPATAELVKAAIDELGFVAHVAARRLASGRSRVIGLVIPTLAWTYSATVLDAVLRVADAHGYGVIVQPPPFRTETLDLLLRSGQVDGVLLVSPDQEAGAVVDFLAGAEAPFVLLEPMAAYERAVGHPTIQLDDRAAARGAMEHLIVIGHRRIAVIGAAPDWLPGAVRERGCADALESAGIEVDPALFRSSRVTNEFEGGYEGLRAVLALDDPPTAAFALTDSVALGVVFAAREAGLAIPRDLSVIGFDDVPLAAQLVPPLTTVRQPYEALAEAAIRALRAEIDGLPAAPAEGIGGALVVRASTAPPRRGPDRSRPRG